MSEAQLQAARAYIEAGDYAAAKAILERMPDNHTAQRWLRKLAEVTTESSSQTFPEPRERWEYCVAGPIMALGQDGIVPHYPVIITYTPNGQDARPIRVGSQNEGNVITSLIAKMGLDGWELVASANVMLLPSTKEGHMLYFKRLLRG